MMKSLRILTGSVLLILTLISCNQTLNTDDHVIDLSGSFQDGKILPISQIASDVKYIQLQTDTNCLLGRIDNPFHQVKFYDNRIFLSDSRKLVIFDSEGHFLSRVNAQGRGPGEYHNINDFAYMPELQQVVIHSAGSRKALFYCQDGTFIKEINVDFWPTRMVMYSNRLVFVTPVGRKKLTDYYALTVMDFDGHICSRLIYCKKESEIGKKEEFVLSTESNNIYILNNDLHFYERLYDSVWSVDSLFNIKSKRYINYGDEKEPDSHFLMSYYENNPPAKRLENAYRYIIISNYIESERYIFYTFLNKGLLTRVYYDKNDNQSSLLKPLEVTTDQKNWAFENDIDGGLPFWPMGLVGDKSVFCLLQAFEFKQHFAIKPGAFNSVPKDKKLNFERIVKSIDIYDNPIIMIATLK